MISATRILLALPLAAMLATSLPALAQNRGNAAREAGERRSERESRRLRSTGEPGLVAAADMALSRAARDEGQYSAWREAATSTAVFHLADGPVSAATWLGTRSNPAVPEQWGPKDIWTSCDGTLAVTFGRFRDAAGLFGSYATVWELQRDRHYKWSYDLRAVDDPQPAPPIVETDPPGGPDTIVVSQMALVQGRVADCPRQGVAMPEQPPFPSAPDHPSGRASSEDGTLMWRWGQHDDGLRYVIVDYLRNGTWEEALDFAVPPPAANSGAQP